METFEDDNAGYRQWLDTHPRGFVINAPRRRRDGTGLLAGQMMLHRTECSHINYEPWPDWTNGQQIKHCTTDPQEVQAWIRRPEVQGALRRLQVSDLPQCPDCQPNLP